MRYFLSLILVLILLSQGYSAVNNSLPIVIESQKLVYDNREKVAHYIGSVIAQHGRTVITGDELLVYFDRTGKHVRKIRVKGNVHIKDPMGEGWCKELIYYPFEERVVLIGNARLKQGKNLLVGDKIVAYRDGRVSVEGLEQKVKSVIYPEEKRSEGRGKRP